MSDKQETIADIIAEMRMGNTGPYPFAYLIGRAGGPLGTVIEQVTVKELADRLEAAHRRELAERGDAAKLREALAPFPSLCDWLVLNAAKLGILDMVTKLRERGDKARAALSAPPRNCDVGTAEEQVERWNNENPYPYEWDDRQYYDALDMLKWAQMPYEAEEGGAE